ncbi:reverse transcriptase domain-containing protein [Tanacetum coccineum]
MYLAVSEESISVVLMVERGKRQVLVYFVSRTLQGAELEYPELEKLILTLVHAARKLRRYFQAHPIQVLSDKPIKQILTRPEKSGHIAKWAIELGEHGIEFRGRNSLFTDGASNFDGSGAVSINGHQRGRRNGTIPTHPLKVSNSGDPPNNVVEYETLLVVANQVKGLFEARQTVIKQYLEKAKKLLANYPKHSIEYIKRNRNKKADALSKLASMTFSKLSKEVLVEVIQDKSITQHEVADVTQEEGDSWMLPIQKYLQLGKLPDDPQKARKIRIKAPLYRIIDGTLYRRSYLSPWLRCVGLAQAKSIIQ